MKEAKVHAKGTEAHAPGVMQVKAHALEATKGARASEATKEGAYLEASGLEG